MTRVKAQSAMEYLMTYGWAILIIAVVLGALFGLGFFNSANLSPKVGPGACQVYRPNGPGTASFINTEGTCNNELPQYVGQFNGASSYISTGSAGLPTGSNPASAFAWVDFTGSFSSSTWHVIYSYGTAATYNAVSLDVRSTQAVNFDVWTAPHAGLPITANSWHFVGWTYGGGTSVTIYVDGQSSTITSITAPNIVLASSNPSTIGTYANNGGSYFQGLIADVQVYNISLSANEVGALYDEGIGGVPLNLNNLVGWWPLNGNSNDYSGNLNNGASTNVIYTSSWTSSYSAP